MLDVRFKEQFLFSSFPFDFAQGFDSERQKTDSEGVRRRWNSSLSSLPTGLGRTQMILILGISSSSCDSISSSGLGKAEP